VTRITVNGSNSKRTPELAARGWTNNFQTFETESLNIGHEPRILSVNIVSR
jgi:hypothetical protein